MVQAVLLVALGLAVGQAPEKKFVVVGKVVEAGGWAPMEGVRVWASTGMGTLFVSGETKTGADGQFRLEFPGRGVAIIGVQKSGWHGRYQGLKPQYFLSERPLAAKDVPGEFTNLVVGASSQVEFRMEPASQLKGKLLNAEGKPMADTRLWLTGADLRLGSSVLSDTRTDADGSFTIKDIPQSPYRLVLAGDSKLKQTDLELGSINFREPGEYSVSVTVHERTPLSSNVSLKVVRSPNR